VKKNIKKYGFTLIELLVVISIIGMISSVVLASINNARKKASNLNVRSTVNAIRTALELYYDTNGKWPSANDGYMVIDNRDTAT
jgi:prepilin-type N-terminal cleavage/methylation domain-containing protein